MSELIAMCRGCLLVRRPFGCSFVFPLAFPPDGLSGLRCLGVLIEMCRGCLLVRLPFGCSFVLPLASSPGWAVTGVCSDRAVQRGLQCGSRVCAFRLCGRGLCLVVVVVGLTCAPVALCQRGLLAGCGWVRPRCVRSWSTAPGEHGSSLESAGLCGRGLLWQAAGRALAVLALGPCPDRGGGAFGCIGRAVQTRLVDTSCGVCAFRAVPSLGGLRACCAAAGRSARPWRGG